MTQLSPPIQNEIFPGALMFRVDIPSGGGAPELSGFAGRFAALLDRANAVRETPGFAAETSYTPPESASSSPIREPDPFYDSRPPDAPPPFSAEADNAATDAADADDAEMAASPADDDEEEAQAFQDGGAEWAAQALHARTSTAENAPAAEIPEDGAVAEDGLARVERGREKAALPSEDGSARVEPGLAEAEFEEDIFAEEGADAGGKSAPGGDLVEADAAGEVCGSPARFEEPQDAAEEAAGKSPVIEVTEASSGETAVPEAAPDSLRVERPGAEEAALAPEREGRGAEFAGAKVSGEALPENAAAELAALPGRESPRSSAGAEEEGREEPGEARKDGRRKERFSVELRDFRTAPNGNDAARDGNAENDGGGSAPGDHGQEQEIIVDLKSQARSQAELSYSRESRGQLSFRDTLARELHENLNGDIVRHASVVLRNGGEGLIRLSLRPEHLGNVKIRLEMSENKVTGQIVVESGEALRAFEQELRSLEQAFRDSGFEGASLEMSVASDGGRGGAYREGGEDAPFFSERLVTQSYDAASGDAGETRWVEGGGQQVNVLA